MDIKLRDLIHIITFYKGVKIMLIVDGYHFLYHEIDDLFNSHIFQRVYFHNVKNVTFYPFSVEITVEY